MPVSIFLLSVAQLLLASNWILEGNFRHKFNIIKSRKAILLILTIYLIHILGLFNTHEFFKTLFDLRIIVARSSLFDLVHNFRTANIPTNFIYALHDLRIKLPLLALPVIYGTSEPLSKKEFKIIMQLFIASVLVSSFITTFVLLGFSNIKPVDSRYASLFISHIRFSLIVVLSIFSVVYITFTNHFEHFKREKLISFLVILWFISFLILLRSFTGIVIFLILFPIALIWCAYYQKKILLLRMAYLGSFLILIGIFAYSLFSYHRFNRRYDCDLNNLETFTVNGNLYRHYPTSDEYENGYKIWINLCEKELAKEWNLRSNYKYDSLDRKGQSVRTTLIRYLTSHGYRKDSLGVSKLDKTDIEMIDKGYTNYLDKNKFALYPRIYELLWEIDRYKKGGDPSGQSLSQRIEYLKTGTRIMKRFFWFGTGTGDVQNEFYKQYAMDNSKLHPPYRHRTHNQFITLLIAFGIFGFVWIYFALFATPVLEKKYRNFMFMIFFLIGILSMLNEDTLETHVGVSFFAFFYSFFLFSMPQNESSIDD